MFRLQIFPVLLRRVIAVRIGIFIRIEAALHIHMLAFSFLAFAGVIVLRSAHFATILHFEDERVWRIWDGWPPDGSGSRNLPRFFPLRESGVGICHGSNGGSLQRTSPCLALFSAPLLKRTIATQHIRLSRLVRIAALFFSRNIDDFPAGNRDVRRKRRFCDKEKRKGKKQKKKN